MQIQINTYKDEANDTDTNEDEHILPTKFVSEMIVIYPWGEEEHEVCVEVDDEKVKAFLVVQYLVPHRIKHVMKLHLNNRPTK